ncbi:MAG TPA: GNAT family N-acetyltransferase [Acidimicrobiales bacterium]|jgi:ribosomal protein S18 acetylase RimI-like enzyme|nr:GNAT family N-acetyltransferase [Acidimicrobiales bacterium]
MSLSRYTTRLAGLADAIFLREMVYEAVAGLGRDRPAKDDVLASPSVQAFVEQWGRPGDHGIVAECDLEPVGAAWFRIFPDDDPEGGFVGGQTPELLIALVPEHRGKRVGDLLLTALVGRAREERMPTIGLNVQRANLPAVSLFRRHGFVVVRDVDGVLTMQLRLTGT